MRLTIGQIAVACDAALPEGLDDCAEITGVSTDTRQLRAQDVFVALRGENFDGTAFVPQALQQGAALVIVDRPVPEAGPRQLLVEDTRVALGKIARFWRDQLPVRVVAVTGSAGKTTTKDLLASICSQVGPTVATIRTENNEIGVPHTLLRLQETDQYCVLEFGMRGRGEIRQLAEMSGPDVGVITIIGDAHLGRLGSREAIAESKAELLPLLPEQGFAVLPADDFFYPLLSGMCHCSVVPFGLGEEAQVRCLEILSEDLTGTRFRMALGGEEIEVNLTVPGRHNVSNALAAAAAGLALGIPGELIAAGLRAYTGEEMRGQILEGPGGSTIINDTYNASPTSIRAALQMLGTTSGRRLLVFGDMGELGDAAPEAHRQVGALAVEAGVEVLITVGEMAALAAEVAGQRGVETLCAKTPEEAADLLRPLLRAGDIVLIKASRTTQLERTLGRLLDDN